jgi:sporulation protein Cse60
MIEVHVVESPNTILLQTEINKFLEGVDRANLIDIKFTSPQIDSVAPPAKYAAMIIYEHKSNMDQPVGIE